MDVIDPPMRKTNIIPEVASYIKSFFNFNLQLYTPLFHYFSVLTLNSNESGVVS